MTIFKRTISILQSKAILRNLYLCVRCFSTSDVKSAPREYRNIIQTLELDKDGSVDKMSPEDLDQRVEFFTNFSDEEMREEMEKLRTKVSQDRSNRKFHTIRRKYFDPKGPKDVNLLTWDMKEHLRYLHSIDPQVWTPEALTKAFPVSVEAAKALIKSKWKPEDEEAIRRHDLAVIERWKIYAKGQLGKTSLLEKIVKERIKSMARNSDLPVPAGTSESTLNFFKNLKFMGEKDLFRPTNDHIRGIRAPPQLAKPFKSIIQDYNEKVRELDNERKLLLEGANNLEDTKPCDDLNNTVDTDSVKYSENTQSVHLHSRNTKELVSWLAKMDKMSPHKVKELFYTEDISYTDFLKIKGLGK